MKYMPIFAILTGLFEISFALYFSILTRKNKRLDLRVLIILLFLLSSYQLLEAYNCVLTSWSIKEKAGPFSVRLSFLFITWLPALGVYLGYITNPNKNKIFKITSYLFLSSALFFSFWFMIYSDAASIKICKSFIAIYSNRFPMYKLYGAYYQAGTIVMLIFSVINMAKEDNKNKRLILQDFTLGGILFIVPSLVLTSVFSQYKGAIPSVMCHFALILGIFIVKILFRERKLFNETK